MHSRIRLRRTAPALLSAGLLLAAGCAQETSRPASTATEDVLLQAAADPGPSPFTGSSAAAPAAAPGTHPDSRSPAPPGDCPPSAGPTPPGEPAGATGVPARSPGETNCPTPTGAPTGPQPDEPRSDEPEPDEPPRDPVPSMTGEPQTSIQLPRHERPVDGGAARRR
ncbi:hypothetical protein ABZ695_20680 [Streptomyces sp. NPDC006976]|uniref:hypothetical protein n=1 Tax=Streptomyces sp. NPDC006976 TaxID=3154311 RepID=UPI0033E03197